MRYILLAMILGAAAAINAQKVIPLFHGPVPGSENWKWPEKEVKVAGNAFVFDVSRPALVVYQPLHSNGTALIVAPGGAFHALAMDLEGTPIAKELTAKGVTVFILKYRLVHDDPAHPENALMKVIARNDVKKLDSIYGHIVPLAMNDGLTAVSYVRQHASAFHIDPKKIGFMGFSAGGTVALSVVYNATDQDRPDFVAPIYAFCGPVKGSTIPAARTPIFITVASDDDFGFNAQNVQLYLKWQEAKQPAELHVYEKGGHGFGMKTQHLPVDHWMEIFEDWMTSHNYLDK